MRCKRRQTLSPESRISLDETTVSVLDFSGLMLAELRLHKATNPRLLSMVEIRPMNVIRSGFVCGLWE